MDCPDLEKFLPHIFVFVYIFVCSFLINKNINTLWTKIKGIKNHPRQPWHPQFLGILELFMYLTLHINKKSEFIFAWLTIKTVPQIIYWAENRTLYNIFLIGNSMVLICSYIIYLITKSLKNDQISEAIIIGTVCAIFFTCTWLYSTTISSIKLTTSSNRIRKKNRTSRK